MTYLTRHVGEYIVPDEWRNPEWITDFDNFPDPTFDHLKDEYDWGIPGKGLVYGYIKHVAGTAHAIKLFSGSLKSHKKIRTYDSRVHSYFLFAVGAATLLNDPSLMRLPYQRVMCGSDVVHYINKVPLSELFPKGWSDTPLFEKLDGRKHIVPLKYSALFSRTFNETSGVREEHKLKIKIREPKLFKCLNCQAITEFNSANVYTLQNTIAYNRAEQRLERQKQEQIEHEMR